jgi:hypothetical protein
MAPPSLVAVLLLYVLLLSYSVSSFSTAPPALVAVLPVNVQLVSYSVPQFSMAPPYCAVLPVNVVLFMVLVLVLWLVIAPPIYALL